MKITNHFLEGAVSMPSPHHGGPLIKPTLLVMHYTASGGTGSSDARYFQNPAAKASAHFVVDRDGSIVQCVPTNVKAWHAGDSSWRGKPNCNDFSIGIEVDNWGLLTKRVDGKFYSHRDQVIPPHLVYEGKNKRGVFGYWEIYPASQIDSVIAIAGAICEAYSTITEIVGHEDIAPVRKIDPGPAFPLHRFQSIPGGRMNGDPVRRVNVNGLNVRNEPGTHGKVIETIPRAEKVIVLQDLGEWSQISTPTGLIGYVFDQYLT